MSVSHSDAAEDARLLGCHAVLLNKQFGTLQRAAVPLKHPEQFTHKHHIASQMT